MSNNIEELVARLKELPIEQQEICADILSSFMNLILFLFKYIFFIKQTIFVIIEISYLNL